MSVKMTWQSLYFIFSSFKNLVINIFFQRLLLHHPSPITHHPSTINMAQFNNYQVLQRDRERKFSILYYLIFTTIAATFLLMGGAVLHQRQSHNSLEPYLCKGKGFIHPLNSHDLGIVETCIYNTSSGNCKEPRVRVIISTPDITIFPETVLGPAFWKNCPGKEEWFTLLETQDYFPCTLINHNIIADPTLSAIPPDGSVLGIAPKYCNITPYVAITLTLGIFFTIMLFYGSCALWKYYDRDNATVDAGFALLFAFILFMIFLTSLSGLNSHTQFLDDSPDAWCAGQKDLLPDRNYDYSSGWSLDYSSGTTCILDHPFEFVGTSRQNCSKRVRIHAPSINSSKSYPMILGENKACPDSKYWFDILKPQPIFPCKITSEDTVIAPPYCNIDQFFALYYTFMSIMASTCFYCFVYGIFCLVCRCECS